MPVERFKFDSVVKPGMPVLLEVSWPESLEGEYKSSVYDYSLKDKRMRVAMPSYRGRLVPLPKGTRVYVKIVDKSVLYVFQGTVLWSGRWEEDNLFSTVVTIPEFVRRVQRRRFNRIPLRLRGVYTREDSDIPRTFTTLDFSAGGLLMLVGEKLNMNELISITLKLKEDLILEKQPARVVREVEPKREEVGVSSVRMYGVEFQEVGLNLEKKLVRFVMEKEIEYRKKGIIV